MIALKPVRTARLLRDFACSHPLMLTLRTRLISWLSPKIASYVIKLWPSRVSSLTTIQRMPFTRQYFWKWLESFVDSTADTHFQRFRAEQKVRIRTRSHS